MEQVLISVLVPVYNVEKYLPECIECILSQTYSNIEIIFVDDGSSDSSGDICDRYAEKDKRIRVIHKKNGGQAAARNDLLNAASGEYYIFVDSDDKISPKYIENLYVLTQKYGCKIAATILQTFKDGEDIKLECQPVEDICVKSLQAVEWMNYQTKLDTWPVCKIYHKSIFENKRLRYPLYKISEDLALTFILFLETDKVAYSNRIDYFYRLHNNSTDGKPFTNAQMDAAVEVIEFMDRYQELPLPIMKSYICRKVSFSFRMLLKMPDGYGRGYYFKDIIKANRLTVLLDSKARVKTRLACLISFFGTGALKSLFKFIDRRR